MTSTTDATPWWRRAVIYQIYPRSYQDSRGDGVGDLAGIVDRLDHLVWLGVDAIWLSPIYPSPLEDGGYDVADYTDVHPVFGTLDDADALIARAHDVGLRVILDFVPNHTSHRHPWFVSSRASRDSTHRAWYHWHDPGPDGGPPTNWRGLNDNRPGSAWVYDEATAQYVLSTFSPVQPDLNWANPDVRAAMAGALRFWLDRGVDGFRIDMVSFLAKDAELRDEQLADTVAPDAYVRDARRHFNRPETIDHLRELRAVVDGYPDRVLIGEMIYEATVADLVGYATEAGIDLPTNFGLITLPFTADAIAAHVDAYDRAAVDEGVWPNYCLANHDMPRPARFGAQGARLAMLLLLTLRGTPFVYYGDEIGMPNVEVPPDCADDPWPASLGSATRDGVRTPMRWDSGPNAGFAPADVEPWLPIGENVQRVNVAVQRDDADSMLTFTRRLLEVRRSSPALAVGDYAAVDDRPDGCVAFTRTAGGERVIVVANLGTAAARVPLPGDRAVDPLVTTGDVAIGARRATLEVGAGAVLTTR